MKKQNKLINAVAETKIRMGSGQGWFYEIKNALLIGASGKVILDLGLFGAGGLVILALIGFYVVGCIDYDWLKVTQRINTLSTKKYNDHLKNIAKKNDNS